MGDRDAIGVFGGMRPRNIIVGIILVAVVLPLLALGVFLVTFNPNAYAPEIITAVEQATGRTLTLGGPIQIALSLTPTIEAGDVSLANPPDFADPNFLTFQRVEARIALLPLLSHKLDIQRLVLVDPVVTLEQNFAGQADWNFDTTPQSVQPNSAAPPATAKPHRGYQTTLEAVELQNGRLLLKDAKGNQTGALAITDLTGTADSPSAPLKLDAQAAFNGVPFTLNGQVGAIERFSGIGHGLWPVDISLAAAGATATVNGTFAHPRLGKGYDLAITAAIPALDSFQPLAGSAFALPPIHNLTAAAHIADQNALLPAISALFIKAGASDLSSVRPGLALQTVDIEMPSLSQPLKVAIAGTLNNTPLNVTGTAGAIGALLNPAWLPPAPSPANPQEAAPAYQVNFSAAAGGAKLTINGGVATPGGYAGVALAVNAAIADLAALDPLTGTALPAWKNIALQTTVTDPGGLGLAKAVGLDDLTFAMDDAAFGGDASLYFGPQPKLMVSLKGQTIDIDALLAAIPPPAQPNPTSPPPAALPNTPAAVQTGDFTQSTVPLPVKFLQTASADIQLSADTITVNRATYTALQTHAVLANGVLTINPLTAILPGGGVAATATIDATKTPPAETITINAPALALAPFLKAIDVPDDAEGTLQAAVNANGAGVTPHDFFSSVNGELGLASVNGTVDGTVLDSLFGAVVSAVGLPRQIVGAQGPVAVRCFALRIDAANGTGTIRALTLDSSRLMLQGGGTIGFGDESLGIIIRPQLRLAGASIGVPVQIGGTFENPTTSIATTDALRAAAKSALGLPVSIVQQATQSHGFLGQVANALGIGPATPAAEQPDICPAALALGRLGVPGPPAAAPNATPPSQPGTQATPNGPQNLLNSLFGK
jgi:AsmA protein